MARHQLGDAGYEPRLVKRLVAQALDPVLDAFGPDALASMPPLNGTDGRVGRPAAEGLVPAPLPPPTIPGG